MLIMLMYRCRRGMSFILLVMAFCISFVIPYVDMSKSLLLGGMTHVLILSFFSSTISRSISISGTLLRKGLRGVQSIEIFNRFCSRYSLFLSDSFLRKLEHAFTSTISKFFLDHFLPDQFHSIFSCLVDIFPSRRSELYVSFVAQATFPEYCCFLTTKHCRWRKRL